VLLEENKAIVRKFVEALNKKDLALLDDIIASDYIDAQRQGPESAKQAMKMFYKGFPDLHMTIEDILAEDDKVWFRLTARGTHTGDFQGLAPTGKKIIISTVDIFRIVDGKAVQGWTVNDYLNFYKQLGIIEYTEKAKGILPEDIEAPPSMPEDVKIDEQNSMLLEANKAIIRSLYEADNKRDWRVLDELISPDFFEASLKLRGPEAYKLFVVAFYSGFPDWDETIIDIAAEGEKVWVYVKGTGTHTGEFWGITPSNEKMTIMMVQIWRVVDGKVVEKRSVADEMEVYKKAGLIKYTEKGKKLFPKEG
jgi:C-1 hydroxylase